MIDIIDTICKDSIFNFSEIEKKDIDKSLSTLSSDTIKKFVIHMIEKMTIGILNY